MEKLFPTTVVEKTADGQVKAIPGLLYGFRIQFVGVTIGDKVEIRDSLTAGAVTVIFTITAITANEVYDFVIPQGMRFDVGIFHDETITTGTIYGTYAYD